MFIHNISLKHDCQTTTFNVFQASLLRIIVREFHNFHFEHNYYYR